MPGDFSRSTFDLRKHYSQVLMQQGRVQIDADWNEYADIVAYQYATQIADIIGVNGTPGKQGGFQISSVTSGNAIDLAIASGRVYVNGTPSELDVPTRVGCTVSNADNRISVVVDSLLVDEQLFATGQWVQLLSGTQAPAAYPIESVEPSTRTLTLGGTTADMTATQLCRVTTYRTQPNYIGPPLPEAKDQTYMAYLDVWERTITPLEDPDIADVALGGADTAVRSQTVWQVKLAPLSGVTVSTSAPLAGIANATSIWRQYIQAMTTPRGQMAARHMASSAAIVQNQLYRVEIHSGTIAPAAEPVLVAPGTGHTLNVSGSWSPNGIDWRVGQAANLFGKAESPDQDDMLLAVHIVAIDQIGKLLTVDADLSKLPTSGFTWTLRQTSQAPDATIVNTTIVSPSTVEVKDWTPDSVEWQVGQIVRLIGAPLQGQGEQVVLAQILQADGGKSTLTLDADLSQLPPATWRLQRAVTFKWARDNASIASLVSQVAINPAGGATITIQDLGGGTVSGFAGCPWIELTNQTLQLQGAPGLMLDVQDVDGATIKVRRWPAGFDAAGWTIRRWDGPYQSLDGLAPASLEPAGDGILENGIRVSFAERSTYLTGDFWQIPARSNAETIEWPIDGQEPVFLPPAGNDHAYCQLAVLNYSAQGKVEIYDCRPQFGSMVDFLDKTGDTMTGPLNVYGPVRVAGGPNQSGPPSGIIPRLTVDGSDTSGGAVLVRNTFSGLENSYIALITPKGATPKRGARRAPRPKRQASTPTQGARLLLAGATDDLLPSIDFAKDLVSTSDPIARFQLEPKSGKQLNLSSPNTKPTEFAFYVNGNLRVGSKDENVPPVGAELPSIYFVVSDEKIVQFQPQTDNSKITLYLRSPSAGRTNISFVVEGSTTYLDHQIASSRETRRNIAGLSSQEASEALAGLSPVKFNHLDDPSERQHLGFIAEDAPDLVANADQKTIAPMDLIAILTKVVQQQQEQIDALTKRVQALEQQPH
jgi:hypothetical protein